ncbi:alpha/beta-hydrolase [Xylaria sp. CBS 124048]|nr:alpha/beta-hydrolase [Xylaria sp. CBS 124048]
MPDRILIHDPIPPKHMVGTLPKGMAATLKYTLHHYASQNTLQRLGVWEVDRGNKYWIVYIHGGAWRDPRITHGTFVPSIDQILTTTPADTDGTIAGFASIDYRLGPHPDFPQDPATTPAAEYRGARHPDHLDDVRSALAFLQRTYGFASNYLLVGHSAGAALAFQLLATSPPAATAGVGMPLPALPALPAAIIGFGGLYDFTGINRRFGEAYESFFSGAFGDGPSAWDRAAPIKFSGSYAETWAAGKLVVLGSSPEDTLVDEPEAENMARRLRDCDGFVAEERDGSGVQGEKRLLLLKDLRGDHNEVWRSGEHVARMVWIVLRKLEADV